MTERTTSTIHIAAPQAEVMAVIANLAEYPEWAGSVREVDILEGGERPKQARFVLDAGAIKDTYTLDYEWHGEDEVTWTLVEAGMLTAMDGAYRLTATSDGATDVEYELTLDLKIPMIGLLRRKAEKVVIDTALKELKKRVEAES
jgi:ribosome-associated toxin RatA of RatAB toxin-antitoxin module